MTHNALVLCVLCVRVNCAHKSELGTHSTLRAELQIRLRAAPRGPALRGGKLSDWPPAAVSCPWAVLAGPEDVVCPDSPLGTGLVASSPASSSPAVVCHAARCCSSPNTLSLSTALCSMHAPTPRTSIPDPGHSHLHAYRSRLSYTILYSACSAPRVCVLLVLVSCSMAARPAPPFCHPSSSPRPSGARRARLAQLSLGSGFSPCTASTLPSARRSRPTQS